VAKVADRATWISTQVCRFMPQYTLHEGRHFLNVLAIMDALVPDNVIARLSPLECALPIMAAFTHDLGMALSQHEYDSLQDESTEPGKHFARAARAAAEHQADGRRAQAARRRADPTRLGPRTDEAARRNCASRSRWSTDDDTARQRLRVTDNPVSMTHQVIKNYFTQIGKSYSRSPEFNQERAPTTASSEVVCVSASRDGSRPMRANSCFSQGNHRISQWPSLNRWI